MLTQMYNDFLNLNICNKKSVADLKFSLRLSTEIITSTQKKIDIEKLPNSNNNHDSYTGEEEFDNYLELVDQCNDEYLNLDVDPRELVDQCNDEYLESRYSRC